MYAWIAVVWFTLAFGTHFKFGHLFSEAQQLQRGEYQHVNYAYFQNFFHQMLNISQVLASYYTTDDMDCAFKCLAKMSCFSFNFATLAADSNSGRHLCELLASDKYNDANSFVPSRDFHHFAIWSPCESLPCQNGGTCRPLYDTNSYVCQCGEGNNGTYCEHGWQKVNVDPVCFGAKDDSFGTFEIHKPGDIYRLKLVHRSGYVNCDSSKPGFNTNWGCDLIGQDYYRNRINVHITYENNTRIFPANVNGLLVLDFRFYYTLLGFNRNSPEITFNSTPTPLSVVAGQKFRIWYGEDLAKKDEGDNNGTSCTDVYAFRQ
ncbi:uncharacterized protein [Montipora capricornis]|uniref:uncharacterized protein isoform X2 n=1 Tax=Montipora capricornis TaxID=246305 RepID=UPI0035F12604